MQMTSPGMLYKNDQKGLKSADSKICCVDGKSCCDEKSIVGPKTKQNKNKYKNERSTHFISR